jgi:hypothetical protein
MLKKSLQSALVMTSLAFLSMLLTFVVWEILRNPASKTIATEFQSDALSSGAHPILITVIIILFIVFVLPGAFYIRNWSDAYFGTQGAVRWIVFGIVFGCLAQLRILMPDRTVDKGFSAFLLEKGMSAGMGLIFLYVSHFLAFRLPRRKTG